MANKGIIQIKSEVRTAIDNGLQAIPALMDGDKPRYYLTDGLEPETQKVEEIITEEGRADCVIYLYYMGRQVKGPSRNLIHQSPLFAVGIYSKDLEGNDLSLLNMMDTLWDVIWKAGHTIIGDSCARRMKSDGKQEDRPWGNIAFVATANGQNHYT